MASIIPTEISKFNPYIVNTNMRQLAVNPDTTNPYWTDYGWTSAQSTAYKNDWTKKWVDEIFPLFSNPITSTSIVKADTHKFIDDFIAFVRTEKLIEKIIGCGLANNTDATTWNVVLEAAAPTTPPVKITATIFVEVKSLPGGKFDVHARADADSTRASIPRDKWADSVQFAMAVIDKPADTISDPNSKDLTKDIAKQAHFEVDAGSANTGKWMVIYFRWYNTSHPKIAGDWSVMTVVPIG